jgi:hypothetical protein
MWKKSTFSGQAGTCVEVDRGFHKSTFSGGGSACVEVGREDGMTLVRDTKLGEGSPILSFNDDEWVAFVRGVKAGQFD